MEVLVTQLPLWTRALAIQVYVGIDSGKSEYRLWHTVRVPETPRRAIIYARISRDRAGAGLGVERQTADCEALAARIGWTVVETITENDVSAYKGVRKGYRRLLAELEAGRADAVIAWHNDRLHRQPVELEHFMTVVEKHAVEVQFVQTGLADLATPSGRLMARHMGSMGRYESEHRSVRVKAAREQMADQGRWGGGERPFGYQADGLTLHDVEAPVLRAATEMLLGGASLRSIVRMMNDAGMVTTRKGAAWTPLSVAALLRRPRNAGQLVHQGKVHRDAPWPGIVTVDELRAVNDILDRPSRKTSRGNQPRWLGSMLYHCGLEDCGDTLVVGTSGQHRQPAYRCQSSIRKGGPRHVTRAAVTLDGYVSAAIIAHLKKPEFAELYTRQARPPVDVTALRRELAEVDRDRIQLSARRSAKRLSWAQFDTENDELIARQERAEAALGAAQQSSPVAHLASSTDVAQAWKGYDLERRREVLRRVVTVTVLPAGRGRLPDGSYFDSSRIVLDWA